MESKKIVRDFYIFMAIIAVFFLILFIPVFFSRNVWSDRLQKDLAKVLENHYPQTYQVGEQITINSALSTSLVAYELLPAQTNFPEKTPAYGVIARITTLYGIMPAVYIYTGNEVSFVDFSILDSNLKKEGAIATGLKNSIQVQYWCSRIPQIITKSLTRNKDE